MEIGYSDGKSIEKKILSLVEAAPLLSSTTAIASNQYNEWPVRYHLCPERANLMRHLNFSGLDVLELGAGMGPISRYLAETSNSLTVVEGTRVRFSVLSSRLRDLRNWSGVVSNIQQVELSRKFDVVCVVGVLEYSELYMAASKAFQSPFDAFIEKAASFLNPKGVLVLAIENRFGLKYWSGCAEDHTGQLFDGICGYPINKSPKTFSRVQLKQLLRRHGFTEVVEHFPFPDYKICQSVLTRELIEHYPNVAAEIACHRPFENYGAKRPYYFPDYLALRNLAESGMMMDFANSFLMIAAPKGKSANFASLLSAQEQRQEWAWHYAMNRKIPACTVFVQREKLRVEKKALESKNSPLKAARWLEPVSDSLAEGETLRYLLSNYAHFNHWENFCSLLKSFLDWSFDYWKIADCSNALDGKAVDAIFTNATLQGPELNKSFRLFDIEWKAEAPVPKSWFIFRNLYGLREFNLLTHHASFQSLGQLYDEYCSELGVNPDLAGDIEREIAFQLGVTCESSALMLRQTLDHLFNQSFGPPLFKRSPFAESDKDNHIETLERQKRDLENTLNLLPHRVLNKLNERLKRYPKLRTFFKKIAWAPLHFRRAILARFQSFSDRWGWRKIPIEWVQTEKNRYLIDCESGQSPTYWSVINLRTKGLASKTTAELRVRTREGDKKPVSFISSLDLKSGKNTKYLKFQGTAESIELGLVENESVSLVALSVVDLGSQLARCLIFYRFVASLVVRPVRCLGVLKRSLNLLKNRRLNTLLGWIRQQALAESVCILDYYTSWMAQYDSLEASDRKAIVHSIKNFECQPVISILMPVFNTEEVFLRRAIESVQKQLYDKWELCIVDDASTRTHVSNVLNECSDPRIKIKRLEKNGHISVASNFALSMATGEYIGCLDHDDELAETALYQVVDQINRRRDADLLYTDEDKIDASGRRFDPHLKPEWNEALYCSYNLITHFAVYRTELVRAVGGFREGFEGSQDYDLAFRVIEKSSPERIVHIPHILYHWRTIPESTALHDETKGYAAEAARKSIREHWARKGWSVKVEPGDGGYHRVIMPLPKTLPLVSVVIGTRDGLPLLKKIVKGLLHETEYPNLELIIVNNQSEQPETLQYFRSIENDSRVKVISYDKPFNFSAINNLGVAEAKGRLLALLNNDLEVIHKDWLTEMVRQIQPEDVAIVGAKLLYPDRRLQHAGVILGIGGVAGHPHKTLPEGSPDYMGRSRVIQGFSSVTAACMLVKKDVFEGVGGFDDVHLSVAFNDVDLCLRVRKQGYRIVWTPYAKLFHHESVSRGSDSTPENIPRFAREIAYMKSTWGDALNQDPFYNPNLTLDREDFSLAFPPRVTPPWKGATQN